MTTPFPFVSGAVLTAAQMNDITNLPINDQTASYTLVVGDAGKRVVMNVATANTVTVNDSVFTTGDTIFVANKGAGASTLTAGAGVTINSASGLVLVQHQSGQLVALSASSFLFVASDVTAAASGFQFITSGTFSAVATFSMPAGTFTSTFDHYKVLLDINSTSTGQNVGVRVNVAGAAQTGSSYFGGFSQINNAGAVTGIGSSSNSSAVVTGIHGTTLARIELTVFSPADAATRTYFSGTAVGMAADGNTAGAAGGAFFNVAAAHDGLTFVVGGTFGGTFYVYGMKD